MITGIAAQVGFETNTLIQPNQSIELLIIGIGFIITMVVAAVVLDKRINK